MARLREEAGRVEDASREVGALTDHALRARLVECRDDFRRGGRFRLHARVPGLAALREAAFRTLGLMAFPGQLMGAMAMDEGTRAKVLVAFKASLEGFPEYRRSGEDPSKTPEGTPIIYVAGGFGALGKKARGSYPRPVFR